MKLIEKIILLCVVIIGFNAAADNVFVEYKPHYLNKKTRDKSYGKSELDLVEFKNTIQVLEYYQDDYKTKEGNIILITDELNKNWELLWNYTSKANDAQWLKHHKRYKK